MSTSQTNNKSTVQTYVERGHQSNLHRLASTELPTIASLLVCETPFLHSLTIEWMCGCRGGGVNMITDVLYSVNMYIHFYVKRSELSNVMDIAL